MDSRIWKAWLGAFITFFVIDGIVNGVLMASSYAESHVWRSDMGSLMWLFYAITLAGSFFFTWIYLIINRETVVLPGWRYGLMIGIWLCLGKAFATYGMVDISLTMAFQWFVYGVIEYTVAGMIVGKLATKKA